MAIPTISEYQMPQPESFPKSKPTWQPDPRRAVLLFHDVQSYFLKFYAGDGTLISQMVDNLVRLRQWARANDVPVVYTAQRRVQVPSDRGLLHDFWGRGLANADQAFEQVVESLVPENGDIVLTKYRYSAFQRTELQDMMATWGRDQLLIGGVYAHIGCMVTAVDAFMRDIQAFMVGDAVAAFSAAEHAMALEYVANYCGCVIPTSLLASGARSGTTREWLHERVLQLVEEGTEIDPDESLIFYGLDSLQVMKLAGELKEEGIAVSFDELARVPTLNAWWELIEQRLRAA